MRELKVDPSRLTGSSGNYWPCALSRAASGTKSRTWSGSAMPTVWIARLPKLPGVLRQLACS